MGSLLYGSAGISVDFEDRALMHLQIVITAKLRRQESFLFSWTDSVAEGSGRSSIWLDPSIPLFFRFNGNRIPKINRDWIDVLMKSANSGSGLIFAAEPRESELPPQYQSEPTPPPATRLTRTRIEVP
jgi:hypothetical protein